MKTSVPFFLPCLLFFILPCKVAHTQQLELYSGSASTAVNGPTTNPQTTTFYSNTGTSGTFTSFTPGVTAIFSLSNQQYPAGLLATYPGITFGGDAVLLNILSLGGTQIFQPENYGSPNANYFTSAPDAATAGTNFSPTANYGVNTFVDAYFQGLLTPLDARNYYGDLTVTFNRPVVNPVLHITGIGGASSLLGVAVQGFFTEFEMSTPGLTLTRLSGSSHFVLDATNTKILNNSTYRGLTATNFASSTAEGSAGSVMVNTGSTGVYSVTFRLYLRGNGGGGLLPTWVLNANGRTGDAFNISASLGLYSISGNVFNDANGLIDGIVNGAGTNGAGTLFANLIDQSGNLYASSAVTSGGTYSFSNVITGSYRVIIATSATATTPSLPTGWVNTGENIGTAAGSDGNANGRLSVPVTGNVTNANFGINPCANGLTITASVNKTLVCASPSSTVTLTSTSSGGITPYAGIAWAGSGLSAVNTQNTSASPAASGAYSVTLTDAVGCKATSTTSSVTYDDASPSIFVSCSGGNSIRVVDVSGISAASYTWTTTSNGRFYTNVNYDVNSDSDVSHLPAPYIRTKGSYSLTIVNDKGCTSIGTQNIISDPCTSNTVLASNMLGVTAQRRGGNVQLQWAVTNESTVKNYVIEKSIDGNMFTAAGTLTAANTGSHTYSFTDDAPLAGCVKLYYRVNQLNADGGSYYSNTAPVSCNSNYTLDVYPNPVVNGGRLTVNYALPVGISKAQLVVINALGAQTYNRAISSNGLTGTITLPVQQNMAAGIYFIRLVANNWVSKTIKVVVNN